jgi:hypothetical protein
LVKAWVEERKSRIEVFYLPSHAPEFNPDKRLNADMKHVISTKVPVRTKAKLKAASEEHMGLFGQSPDCGRAYFQDPRPKGHCLETSSCRTDKKARSASRSDLPALAHGFRCRKGKRGACAYARRNRRRFFR